MVIFCLFVKSSSLHICLCMLRGNEIDHLHLTANALIVLSLPCISNTIASHKGYIIKTKIDLVAVVMKQRNLLLVAY